VSFGERELQTSKRFSLPHSAHQLDNSVLLFNGGSMAPGACSVATEFKIVAGKAVRVWFYSAPACYQITFLGDATRLWNNNTLVTWATAGRLEEVTIAKKLVWSVHTSLGVGFGYTSRVKSLY